MKQRTKFVWIITSMCMLLGLVGCNMPTSDKTIVSRDLKTKYGEDFEVSSTKTTSVGREGVAYPVNNPDVKFSYIIRNDKVEYDSYIGALLTIELDNRVLPIVKGHFSTGYVYSHFNCVDITSTDKNYKYDQYKNDVDNDKFNMYIMVDKNELDNCTIDDIYACIDDIVAELGYDCNISLDIRAVTQDDIENVIAYRRDVVLNYSVGGEYVYIYNIPIDIEDGQCVTSYEDIEGYLENRN